MQGANTRSSGLWRTAIESATSSELLRGTAMPPTGYHFPGSPPSGTSRISTMYSGDPWDLSLSKSSAALSRTTLPALGGFAFLGAGGGFPKPFAIMTTGRCCCGQTCKPGAYERKSGARASMEDCDVPFFFMAGEVGGTHLENPLPGNFRTRPTVDR